jgi:hypothetical protein
MKVQIRAKGEKGGKSGIPNDERKEDRKGIIIINIR